MVKFSIDTTTTAKRSGDGDSTYTRRRVLASTAGIGAAALLGSVGRAASAATSSSSLTLEVDFSKTEFFPLLKSKIGVGRGLDSQEILDSVTVVDSHGLTSIDYLRPAVFNAQLIFSYARLKPCSRPSCLSRSWYSCSLGTCTRPSFRSLRFL